MFFAGVHDFGAIWASVRNKGTSVGSFSGDVVSPRARTLFMIVIFFLLLMVNAVFAVAISNALVATPSAVIPVWSAIAVAVVIGVLIYKVGVPILWPTVIGTIILYAVIYVGDQVPVELPEVFLGLGAAPQWIVILFVYALIASLLPVWLLLQPRDYINGIQLIIGLGLLFAAVFIANPTIVAPAFNTNVPDGTPPLVPLLFVTIACGAHIRVPWACGVRHHRQAAEQGDRRTFRRLSGFVGRGPSRPHYHHRRHRRLRFARRVGGDVRGLQHHGHRDVCRGRVADPRERNGAPSGVRGDTARRHGRFVRRDDDGCRGPAPALHHPGVGNDLQDSRPCRTDTSRRSWRWGHASRWHSVRVEPTVRVA